MVKTKRNFIAILGLLAILLTGKITYAAEDFFWSDVKPKPSCSESRDGKPKEMGFVIDGKKVIEELPLCEEARKSFVIVQVNGNYLHTNAGTGAEPFVENGRTMIPLRAIADAFKFDVDWKESEQKITLAKDGKSIILHIGKPEILVDGKTLYFDGAVPMLKNGRTFLPAGKLAELLDIQVEWDGDTRTATFTSK
ncbi:copper amine oxidase N-terminal domain-containing protein [Brevibacillus sp. B_LB10_24]|uniref:copper amine oxidase N-terminal domain-containing protein n=1 Tax=Brevibacillus sp. B_LB10_24 TaxID=3380645 RepID=UPI0038BB6D62